MPKLVLPFLETMITQVCNLSCDGCTNYSDLNHKGYVKWDDGKQQLESWLERLDIPDFGIMGGEPLINPQWRRWLYGVRELMPQSQIRFTTNGLLLRKYPDIIDEMIEVGNVVFKITAHTNDADDFIEQALSTHQFKQVNEYGIQRLQGPNDMRFQINRPTVFLKTFVGDYHNMMPHNNDPKKAFENCCQQTCPLLYNGKIYKCSTAGLLKDTLIKVKQTDTAWLPYIDPGIDSNCSDQEIDEFIDNFGKPHARCGQCPTDGRIPHNSATIKVK